MAFMVEKPLLFVLIEADASHMPNTAKKGYPVFALEGLQREGFRTLANFCSYLAADWRSTVRLYQAVFHHLQACAQLAVAVYIFSIVILTDIMGTSGRPDVVDAPERAVQILKEANFPHPPEKGYSGHIDQGHTIDEHKSGSLLESLQTGVSKPAILWFFGASLTLFLVPYGVFFITRLTLRAKLRRVISGKKFRDTFIPETLAYSLKRADLLKILYHGDIVAHHESGRLDAGEP
jgi:hypothetical protein